MSKSVLLVFISLAASGLAGASSLYVSAAGQFSSTDIASQLVAPNASFALRFLIENTPTPVSGSVTSLGFDVPLLNFQYTLNGAAINVAPSEIRFNTLSNGGLFDISFGSSLSAPVFSFQGAQAFTGSTAAPAFSTGNFALTSFTYSDNRNFDAQTPGTVASVTPTPEPSSIALLFCGLAAAGVARFRKLGVAR